MAKTNNIHNMLSIYTYPSAAFLLVSLSFIFVQDTVSKIRDHSRQPLSQGNLRLPAEKLFCFTNVRLPFMRVISCVWSEFYRCTWINGLFDDLERADQCNLACLHIFKILKNSWFYNVFWISKTSKKCFPNWKKRIS